MMVDIMNQTTNQITIVTDKNDYDEHRCYNTGDQIWLKHGKVVQVQTHDGLFWKEGYHMIKLTGWEVFF